MPFVPLTKIKGSRPKDAPATASLVLLRGGRFARLRVSVSADLMRQISGGEKDRFEVLIGTEEAAGILRLRKNNSAGIVSPQRRATHGKQWGVYAFDLGHIEEFPNRAEKKQPCNAEAIDKATIEIVLPDWAPLRKAQHPLSAMPATAKAAMPTPAKPALGTNVTGAAMGDPPPGRSALSRRGG